MAKHRGTDRTKTGKIMAYGLGGSGGGERQKKVHTTSRGLVGESGKKRPVAGGAGRILLVPVCLKAYGYACIAFGSPLDIPPTTFTLSQDLG